MTIDHARQGRVLAKLQWGLRAAIRLGSGIDKLSGVAIGRLVDRRVSVDA
jgi:hypothetical protein